MAYTPCPSSVVSANAVKDCSNPAFEGLKTLAIAIDKRDITAVTRGTGATRNNVSAITLASSSKVIVIEAGGETPFASTTEEFDAATRRYNKTVTFIAPAHGAGFAAAVIEPMLENKDGYVFILQRKDKNGDASYPIIGLEKGAVGASGSMDYNDSATGGCYTLAFTETTAPSSEIDLWDTDEETTDGVFAALLAKAY